jgi:hypothetical protein
VGSGIRYAYIDGKLFDGGVQRVHENKDEICGPGSLLGVQGRLGRGLAQPSDNPTLRLPGAILAFNAGGTKERPPKRAFFVG